MRQISKVSHSKLFPGCAKPTHCCAERIFVGVGVPSIVEEPSRLCVPIAIPILHIFYVKVEGEITAGGSKTGRRGG